MSETILPDHPLVPDGTGLEDRLNRRGFVARLAALGFGAAATPAFLAACARLAEEDAAAIATATPPPAPTPFPTPTPFAAVPTATPIATPTPIPTPTPASSLQSEPEKIAHLLRRAGFGASPAELDGFVAMGLPATIDHLLNYEQVDNAALDGLLAGQELELDQRLAHLQRWWLLRMIHTQRPLEEKLTLFWHGILTSSFRKVGKGPEMLMQNKLLRSHALGRYDETLKAISRDPAMLIWLDSRSNKKRAPNENYARELMELFSLGIGHYTEEDVREAARAFTGWQVQKQDGVFAFSFEERRHDFGEKTFLGTTGNLDGDDVVDIIMAEPASAEFICRKLFEFFAYDDPEPQIVRDLAKIFRAKDSVVRPVVGAILASDAFYSPQAVRAKVKSPAEIVASTVRALGIRTDAAVLPRTMGAMGQELFVPPNVAGWTGGATWINSSSLLERINFANQVATGRRAKLSYDPAAFFGPEAATPERAVRHAMRALLGGEVSKGMTEALVGFTTGASSGRTVSEEALRGLTYLVLASPEYQIA